MEHPVPKSKSKSKGQSTHRRSGQRQPNDLGRSLAAFKPDTTLVAVIEMSAQSWLVAGLVPCVERQPLKKLKPEAQMLLALLERWQREAVRAGCAVTRIAVAYEAGRDGFWLARWLMARGIEVHVIHAASVAVSREHRRAKTDRLDTELLKRAFLGWLRGEREHCKMVAIPSAAEEDARRPGRERATLVGEATRLTNRVKSALARIGIRGFNVKLKGAAEKLALLSMPGGEPVPPNTLAEMQRDLARRDLVRAQIRDIETARLERVAKAPATRANVMLLLLARVIGVGIETADSLVNEILSRNLRDRRAVARYGGLTGSPDRSGSIDREKGLARAGNKRVRHVMIELAWRFVRYQPESALVKWFHTRTASSRGLRKSLIVALARKLLIAMWRLVHDGVVPQGVAMREA